MSKILIAYYSHSGITKKVAEEIHQVIGGDTFEIQEAEPYPRDYNSVVKQAKKEIADGFKPLLKDVKVNIGDYDMIIVGSPNWWSTIAPPVTTFLSSADFSGKTIAPFITHGGGGLGNAISDMKRLCPGADVLDGLDANYRELLSQWIRSLK